MESPNDIFGTKKIVFYDWDDTIIGVLILANPIRDGRPFVNFFTCYNLIHPDLQLVPARGSDGQIYQCRAADLRAQGVEPDPWAQERETKYREAKARWPNRQIYTEEAFYFSWRDGGRKLHHALRYLPGKYVKPASLWERQGPFRPEKEVEP